MDTKKGDTFALQYWRDTLRENGDRLASATAASLENFSSSVLQLIENVFAYFLEPQEDAVDPNSRPDFADIRPKSAWERSARFVKNLQTSRVDYSPSQLYQRVHYENIHEGTQTDVLRGHFGITAQENLTTWPYIGEKDWDGNIIGAPVFIWSRKRKREGEGEEVRQEPRRVPAQGDMNGWDIRVI